MSCELEPKGAAVHYPMITVTDFLFFTDFVACYFFPFMDLICVIMIECVIEFYIFILCSGMYAPDL